MKKVKYKTGDIINIPLEHSGVLKTQQDEINALRYQIEMLSESIVNKSKSFWNFIHQAYPGTCEYRLSVNHASGKLIIKDKID